MIQTGLKVEACLYLNKNKQTNKMECLGHALFELQKVINSSPSMISGKAFGHTPNS